MFFWAFSSLLSAQIFDVILSARLQGKIDSIRKANNVKGISACVIIPGNGTWKGVTGISHPGYPITSDMEFGIASNTKLFTGVLLLKLAEHNIIRLDDSLHSYLPTFKNINPDITIRQLLNHTSGLADVTNVAGYPDSILTNPNRIFTPAELITWVGPPSFTPGTGWEYCNTNYLLAGMIAESATGMPFGKLLRDSILNPLQLDSTFLDVYENVLNTIANPWQAGVNNITTPRKSLNTASWAAGAMYSTTGEMAQWYQVLMSGKVINSSSMKELTTFVGSGNYSIGISNASTEGRTVWQHGGNIWGGYSSFMMYEPATGIVVCVLINQQPAQANMVARQLLSVIVNNPISIDTISSDEKYFSLYPNPTHEWVTISNPTYPIGEFFIYNHQGALVYSGASNSHSVDVNISGLANGLYLLAIPEHGNSARFIKRN